MKRSLRGKPFLSCSLIFLLVGSSPQPLYLLLRAAEKSVDSGTSPKRRNCPINGQQDGLTSQTSRDFQGLTVERLCSFLKSRDLSPKGKKDELIARLKGANG